MMDLDKMAVHFDWAKRAFDNGACRGGLKSGLTTRRAAQVTCKKCQDLLVVVVGWMMKQDTT